MTGFARSICPAPALATALLAALLLPGAVGAQERSRIEVVPQIPHAARVLSAAFSPDGAQVVTGSQDGTVKLWDAATGRLVRTLGRHSDRDLVFQVVAFSPDGTRALSGIDRGGMKLWDVTTGRLIRAIDTNGVSQSGLARSVAFLPDGTRALAGLLDGKAALWDIATGQHLQTFDHGDPRIGGVVPVVVAFSPDGAALVTVGLDQKAKLWDAATGKLVRTFASSRDIGNILNIAVAFSSDGARMAVATEHLSTQATTSIELWDAATGELIRTLEGSASLRFVAFSKDGALLLGTGWGLQSEDIAKGGLETIFGRPVIALSADGNRVLSSERDVVTALSLWDLKTGQQTGRIVGHDRRLKLTSLAVSPDGDQLLAGGLAWPGALLRSAERGDPAIALWDVAGGKLVRTRRLPDYEEIAKFAFSPEGAVALSHDSLRKLTQWNVATGKSFRTTDVGDIDVYRMRMDVSADGTRVVTLSEYAKRIVLWDVAAAKAIRTFDMNASVQAVAISRDGARIAAGSSELKVRVWDAAKGDLVHTFDVSPAKQPQRHSPVTALAFSAGGAVLAACQGHDDDLKRVTLWDVASGQLVRTFDFPCAGSVAVSPDAMHVLAGDNITIGMPEADLRLRLGDTATGRLIHSLDGTSAAFARDGRRVFWTSYDGAIRIWDTKIGGLIASLLSAVPPDIRWPAKGDLGWLAVTPEGFFDASSEEFAASMLSIVRGLKVSVVDGAAYQVLHRPDLVRAKLAGDLDGRVNAAAAELQVKLGMK